MEPLKSEQIRKELEQLNGWDYADNKISKDLTFANFKEAMGFIVRAGFEAEAQGHHPEWTNVYNTVSISLCTHDAGDKVTSKDIDLAKAIDKIYKNNG